jgi:hypothetical protein
MKRLGKRNPLYSVESLDGTVMGVLFDKKGSEIKEAVMKKISYIDTDITKYMGTIERSGVFLKDKEKLMTDMDDLYQKRLDERQAKRRPFERDIEQIQKKWEDVVFDFNKDTEKAMVVKAVDVAKDFEDFEKEFEKIDELLFELDPQEKDVEEYELTSGYTKGGNTLSRMACFDSGKTGATGGAGTYTVSNSNISEVLDFSEEEDKALSKINTLKGIISNYKGKISSIKGIIKSLEEEKKHLTLMKEHLSEDQVYKLDLEKLIAFGFAEAIN